MVRKFIDVPAHQIKAWRFLGYFLLVPILISPVIVVDPFVPEGGNGETSLAFSIICGLVGTGLLIYYYRFSIQSVRIGERITVNYAIRTMIYEWANVEEVVIERRLGKLDGVPLEMFYLRIHMQKNFMCMNVARELIPSITAIVKIHAPKSCKFSGEIQKEWVGSS